MGRDPHYGSYFHGKCERSVKVCCLDRVPELLGKIWSKHGPRLSLIGATVGTRGHVGEAGFASEVDICWSIR